MKEGIEPSGEQAIEIEPATLTGRVLSVDDKIWARGDMTLSQLTAQEQADVVATLLHDPYTLDLAADDRVMNERSAVDECIVVLPTLAMDRSIEPPIPETDASSRKIALAALRVAAEALPWSRGSTS